MNRTTWIGIMALAAGSALAADSSSKDGNLTEYQSKVSGKRQNRDGDEVEFERTTTVEIKDVGSTKLDLPEEAKKKLSAPNSP